VANAAENTIGNNQRLQGGIIFSFRDRQLLPLILPLFALPTVEIKFQ